MKYGAGGSFGELALFCVGQRSATITTSKPTVLWRLDRPAFTYVKVEQSERGAPSKVEQLKLTALDSTRFLKLLTPEEKLSLLECVHDLIVPKGCIVIGKGDATNVGQLVIGPNTYGWNQLANYHQRQHTGQFVLHDKRRGSVDRKVLTPGPGSLLSHSPP